MLLALRLLDWSGGTGATVAPGAGTLTITGLQPDVSVGVGVNLTPGAGVLRLVGLAPSVVAGQGVPAVIPHDDYDQPPDGFRRLTDTGDRQQARRDALRQMRREIGLEKEPDPPPSFVPQSEVEVAADTIETVPVAAASFDLSFAQAVAQTLIEAIKQDDEEEIKAQADAARALRLMRDNEDVLLLLAAAL